MVRSLLCVVTIAAFAGQAAAIDIWLSASDDPAAPPANLAAVPTLHNFVSQGAGSVFVWARPDSGKTLERWSLRLTSSDSSILSFDSSAIEDYNLLDANGAGTTDDEVRWEFTHEPAGNSSQVDLLGFNILLPSNPDRVAEGIGPSCNVKDEFCGTASDAKDSWLLAKINYTLSAVVGQTDLFFQIGDEGISHQGETSSQASVTFGDASDGALNGETDRLTSSTNADAFIIVHPDPDADFDSDGDVDGQDFLTWQRGFGSGTMKSQGDATSDAVVDEIDLAAWGLQYGSGVGPLGALKSVTVPEPTSAALAGGMLLVVLTGRRTLRRIRQPKCGGAK